MELGLLEAYGNTVGGVGPTGGCELGAQRWVPYTADYYFYATP